MASTVNLLRVFSSIAASSVPACRPGRTQQTPCRERRPSQPVANTSPPAALSFRKLRNSIQLTDVNFNMTQMPCGLQVILTEFCKHYAMHEILPQASTVWSFFAFHRAVKSQRSLQIWFKQCKHHAMLALLQKCSAMPKFLAMN